MKSETHTILMILVIIILIVLAINTFMVLTMHNVLNAAGQGKQQQNLLERTLRA